MAKRQLPSKRVGFTLGAGESSDFENAASVLKENLEGINKVATGKGGFFNKDTLKEFGQAIKVNVSLLGRMRDEHKKINLEIRERERRIKDIEKIDRQSRERRVRELKREHKTSKWRAREIEKIRSEESSVDPGAHSDLSNLRARSMSMQQQLIGAGTQLRGTQSLRGNISERASMVSPRSAFVQAAGGRSYQRWQQFRQNPRLGLAQIGGAAAGALSGSGLSGALMGAGAQVFSAPGGKSKVLGGLLMAGGAMLGASKKLAKLGIKVGGWAVGQIMQGIPTVIENQMGAMQLEGAMGVRRGKAWRQIMGRSRSYGFRMGYTPAQAYGIAQQSLLASGRASSRDVMSNMAMMRGYSLDSGTLFGAQSAARHYGGGGLSPEKVNEALLTGFKKAKFAKPLLREFVQGLTGVVSHMEGGSVKRMSAFMGMLGQSMGGQFAKSPMRTAGVMQRLQQGISNPQGFAREAEVMLALGLGSGKSYYEVQRRKARSGPSEIRDLLKYQYRKTGGNIEMMGDSLHSLGFAKNQIVGEALSRAYVKHKDKLSAANINAIRKGKQATPFGAAAQASKRLGMWKTMEGLRQARAAAAVKHQKNIKEVMGAYMWAINQSTGMLKQFTDALRGAITQLVGKPPAPSPSPVIKKLPGSTRAGQRIKSIRHGSNGDGSEPHAYDPLPRGSKM